MTPPDGPATTPHDFAVDAAVSRLLDAAATGRPCDPLRDLLPATLQAGYEVQDALTRHWAAGGRRPVGRKIGLTNPKVQSQLKVDQPDLGVLYDDMAVRDGGRTPMRGLLQPRIEAEVAVRLGADLDAAAAADPRAVRESVAGVCASFEIVDSRIRDWDISILDTVADNASSGRYVLGSAWHDLGERDLRAVEMTAYEGGREVSRGTGRDCLGDPLAALAWLAGLADRFGAPLRAGDIVLTGALGPMVDVQPGQTYRAELSGLGSVSVSFGEKD
jgi:2-keto-4-pentenoate hydratase